MMVVAVVVVVVVAGGSKECSAPTGLECAGGLSQSRLIAASRDGGLRAECPGSVARYLRADPMTGGILEMCGGNASALAVAPCGETRIGGLVVDGDAAYYTTGTSVRVFREGADVEVAGAYGVILVRGAALNGARKLAFRDHECAQVSASATEAICTTGNPALVGPTSSSLEPRCVRVETEKSGTATSPTIAMLRDAEYGAAAPPSVFEVEVVESYALRARALALAGPRLLVSSIGTPGSFPGILALSSGRRIEVLVRDAPRVLGLAYEALDATCGWLYYSDAHRAAVVRRPSCAGGAAGDQNDIVLAATPEPRGLALDPTPLATTRRGFPLVVQVYASTASRIKRISIVEGIVEAVEDVVSGDANAAPDGLLLLPRPRNSTTDRKHLRLVWLDANHDRFFAATPYGTRQTAYPARHYNHRPFRFPRALAYDFATSRYLVGEWLGRLWDLPLNADATHARLLRDDTSTAAAHNVRAALDAEDLARLRLQPALRTLLVPS